MARFTAVVEVAASAERTWAALVDWPAHGRWLPATTVTVLTPSGAGVGARFVGRTGFGPLSFDDPMEITEWAPPGGGRPGRCQVVKQGRVVLGEARFEVRDAGTDRCVVAWTEDVVLVRPVLTRVVQPLIVVAGRIAFTRALRAMAAQVEAAVRAGG